MKQPRDILTVMNQLILVDSSLKEPFDTIASDAKYTAPEIMPQLWTRMAIILSSKKRKNEQELIEIFNGGDE